MNDTRWWYLLLVIGLVLQIAASFTNDLGLDAHVRLNVAQDVSEEGAQYPWGPTRLASDELHDPLAVSEYDGYIGPWFSSSMNVKLFMLASMFMLIGISGRVPSWRRDELGMSFDPRIASLVALSPPLIFATGRGYDEALLALLMGGSVFWLFGSKNSSNPSRRLGLIGMATSLLLIAGWKGFGLLPSFSLWLTVIISGFAWELAHAKWFKNHLDPMTHHPWKMSVLASFLVLGGVSILGATGSGGTLNIVANEPFKFALAFILALLDGVVLFLLIGFCLWPLFKDRISDAQKARGPNITMLAVFISIMATCITVYIAALWTVESQLWNASLLETAFLLGNNGRYMTVLILPCIMLFHLIQDESDESMNFEAHPSMKALGLALVMILPMTLFIAVHGQQLWTDEAGEVLNDHLDSGDTFLLVTEPSLALHSLYSLKTEIDLSGDEQITGYWRDSLDATDFLNSPLGVNVTHVLVGPDDSFVPENSSLLYEGNQPFSLSKLGQSSGWRLFQLEQ